MLKQRVITAVILLLALLPALFASSYVYFAALALLTVMFAQWEWAKLLRFSFASAVLWAFVLGIACAYVWYLNFAPDTLRILFFAVLLAWVLALGAALSGAQIPAFLVSPTGRFIHMIFATAALCSAWAVMALAKQHGAWFVLSLLAVVWAGDTAAYFVGKRFGKHKLAPKISPGKTREGAYGGIAGGVALCLACYPWQGTFFAQLGAGSWLKAVLISALLVVVSIGGDLYESMLKRQAGAKDSSHLLPGHGGVLDRVDALLPTLPLAWLML